MVSQILGFCWSPVGRWVTIAVWLAVVMVTPFLTTLNDLARGQQGVFLPSDAESRLALEVSLEAFPTESTSLVAVVLEEGGLGEEGLAAAEALGAWLRSDDAPDEVINVQVATGEDDALFAEDGTAVLAIAEVSGNPDSDEFLAAVEAVREYARGIEGGGVEVFIGGAAGLIVDLQAIFDDINTLLLFVTVTLVVVLLLLLYRSPVVAMLPLLSVGFVYQLSNGLGAIVAQELDFAVSGQATGIMTVVLWGTGTDYCLFLSARYREELRRHEDKYEALRATMNGVGGAVAAAGGTIMVASAIVLLADLGFYNTLAPVVLIAVSLMVLAALTLVPALLAVTGRFAFWPFRPRFSGGEERDADAGKAYLRIANYVTRRPVLSLAATLTVLGSLILGLIWFDPTYDQLDSLPSDRESVRSFELVRERYPAGLSAPTEVFVRFNGEVLSAEAFETLEGIGAALLERAAVSDVRGPHRPGGMEAPLGPEEVLIGVEGGSAQVEEAVERFVSAAGDVALLEVTLSLPPFSPEALDVIPELRVVAQEAVPGLADDDVLMGGSTAEGYDTREANLRDTLLVLPLILLAIGVILGLLLRSLIAPLYLVATILFTYFSTLGIAVFCFTFVFGHEGISPYVPFYMFVFLNALGVDYNIYLMSRIREESERTGHVREAARLALAQTGGVITSAGLILAGTFSALMTLSFVDLFQLGFAVAVGVLMDTFVTRTLIVPAIVAKLGRWNWWPGKASKQVG